MQAIILAAGMGRRLKELTSNNTKCMLSINGSSLIERMLNALDPQDLKRIIIVTGYQAENLMSYVDSLRISTPIEYIENREYERTNNIYSLYLASEQLAEDDTLLLESDLIFEPAMIDDLVRNPFPNLVLAAKYQSWMDGTVVTLDDEDNITSFIDKKHFSYSDIDSYYKTVNIYKFSKEFSAKYYVPFLVAYSTALGNNAYYEQVLRVITLLDEKELKVLRLDKDDFWYEIDDIQDLDIAESIFAPNDNKLKKIEQRYGGYWRYPSLLDFCYLVNPFFPNSKLLAEIKSNFERLISEYPSGMAVNSLLAAKNFRVRQEHIAIGNGAAELIKSLDAMLPGKVGITYPTFEEYPNRLPAERIVPFHPNGDNFHYTAQNLIDFFDPTDLSALLIVNPDNPSGNYIDRQGLLSLCEWSKRKGITLVVDESFADFAQDDTPNTLIDDTLLEQFPQLVVVKSISKSYGVPGLRLGVLAGSDRELIARLKKDVAIWNINSLAEFYMQIFGKYETSYRQACRLFREERDRFMASLRQIPFLRVLPSQANFFMCEVLPPYGSLELTERLLSEYDILIKDCSRKKAMKGRQFIRLAVRSREDNERLVQALNELQKQR